MPRTIHVFVQTAGPTDLEPDEPGRLAPRRSILIAQPDGPVRRALASVLRFDGYDVRETDSGAALLEGLGSAMLVPGASCPYDLVWARTRVGDSATPQVIDALGSVRWTNAVVLVTLLEATDGATPSLFVSLDQEVQEIVFARLLVRQLVTGAQVTPILH